MELTPFSESSASVVGDSAGDEASISGVSFLSHLTPVKGDQEVGVEPRSLMGTSVWDNIDIFSDGSSDSSRPQETSKDSLLNLFGYYFLVPPYCCNPLHKEQTILKACDEQRGYSVIDVFPSLYYMLPV